LILNEKEKDFFFVKRAYSEDIVKAIVELAIRRLPKNDCRIDNKKTS